MTRHLVLLLALAALAAPAAHADGLPVLGVDVGSSGVSSPQSAVRYVTIPAGASTLVERVRRDGGQVLGSTFQPGTFTIPAVAYDRSAGGLSGDGRTLVLIEPRVGFPRATTNLLVLDARTLAYRAAIHLRGDFSYDAVSPSGDRVFLIQYTSPRDPTRYRVRAYDVAAGRLDPQGVVDPRKPSEQMRGNPLSRASSADGRFAYTLYDGNGKPFVHALDTRDATARCIDLELPSPLDFSKLRVRMTKGGQSVAVRVGAQTLATIDTGTLAIQAPQDPGMNTGLIAALALAGAMALALAAWRLARRARSPRREAVVQ